jgi:heme-degrading monooxygenase HmoA
MEMSAMILELAQIEIKPGLEGEFEQGVRNAMPLFQRAKGFQSLQIRRVLESPGRYQLLVCWQSIENHTEDFVGSEDFKEWRRLVGHCFAQIPSVQHSSQVFSSENQMFS